MRVINSILLSILKPAMVTLVHRAPFNQIVRLEREDLDELHTHHLPVGSWVYVVGHEAEKPR